MIILYDHVHPVGAFAKNAPIDVSHINVADSCELTHTTFHISNSALYL